MISLLRSAVAEPGRRLNGALMILMVIIGVVTMHSMSGSPTSHHHGPHDVSTVVAQDVAAAGGIALPAAPDSHTAVNTAGPVGECHDGCGGHDAAMAMCLMILVALLALVAPARRFLWRVLPAWSVPVPRVAVDLRALTAPSLHELCISRT
ncbi:DUF6153 family protein [Promicromonospora iranensis]|uniref:Cytochrome c oxidase assembly factor CtaG n=1 Tax=Promicromonospora iranensis TaxID=1105144 RepID=A0ABU2CTQ5_9MICO|nr:DUF6153 family protein [Promicromonospora iranensis]MDR7384725.1 cytochrome c oxidase assembly factor CtaG [Promicromonospora iranensis]